MANEWIERASEMDLAFRQNTVWTASDEKLVEYLQTLSTGYVSNDEVRHREIIRGITINHIQMARIIKRLDEDNQKLSRLVVILTIIATLSGIVQVVVAIWK